MSNLCEVRCMANAVKFYDGKDHLAVVTDGKVRAYGAAVNGSVTVLDGEPVHGFAMAFVDAAVWNTVAAGKPAVGTEVVVLAMCEDNGVKPGIKNPYHDFKVVEVLDVSLVDKLTPAAREMIAARGVIASTMPYVSEISSGNRKVAKM